MELFFSVVISSVSGHLSGAFEDTVMLRNTLGWLAACAAVVAVTATIGGQERPRRIALGDWPECAVRSATASRPKPRLPEKWALNGENFLWRAPYGGRSSPIVMGDHVYVQNPSGRGASTPGARHVSRCEHRQGRCGNTSSTSSRATCRRTVSDGRRRRRIRKPGNVYALAGNASVIALEQGRQARCGSARSAKSSRRSRRTAAAPRRRSSTAIWSS